jgi:hypothetical protein
MNVRKYGDWNPWEASRKTLMPWENFPVAKFRGNPTRPIAGDCHGTTPASIRSRMRWVTAS